MNSQTERTRLAWRRTFLALLVVGGIGAVHLATAGLTHLALTSAVITAVGCVTAARRLSVLRRSEPVWVPTWEPLVLTLAGCLLALTVLVGE